MNKPNMSRYQFWNKQTLGLVLGVALIVFLLNFFKGWSVRFQPPFVFEYNIVSPMTQEELDRQDKAIMKAIILDEMVENAVKEQCPSGEKGKETTEQTNTLLRTSGEARATVIEGQASWYGATPEECLGCNPNFIMANGEKLDGKVKTIACAVGTTCNDFPIGSLVEVINLENMMTTNARVTDTGGFAKYNRVADISKAVKGAINCEGLCRVRVTVLERGSL